jgi:DNA-directed RNA polymerase alpha subunit
VTQIVAANDALDRLRAVLEKKYGVRPNIRQLADQTPIEVLILCDADMHGWAVRVKSLRRATTPIKTIGNVRRMTDEELLRIPGVGKRMLAELRSFCPSSLGAKKG